ncbi:hypothetical protein REPUB_Repub02eG0264000 [Reevesia pubescens]
MASLPCIFANFNESETVASIRESVSVFPLCCDSNTLEVNSFVQEQEPEEQKEISDSSMQLEMYQLMVRPIELLVQPLLLWLEQPSQSFFSCKDTCPECDGAGFVRQSGAALRANAARKDQSQIVCAPCNGLGKLNQFDK